MFTCMISRSLQVKSAHHLEVNVVRVVGFKQSHDHLRIASQFK